MVHRRVILARHLGVYELKVAFTFLMLESEEEASFVTCDSDRPSSVRQGSLMGTHTPIHVRGARSRLGTAGAELRGCS